MFSFFLTYVFHHDRFDLRPFLYRVAWTWQFRCIDEQVQRANEQLGQVMRTSDTQEPFSIVETNTPTNVNTVDEQSAETRTNIKTEKDFTEEQDDVSRRSKPLTQIEKKRKLATAPSYPKVKLVSLAPPSSGYRFSK